MDMSEEQERDRWWLVVAAGLAVYMAAVDMSIVHVALPAITADLGTSAGRGAWVVLAYLLPLAGLALPSGRWLDVVGRRAALVFSLGGFALASVAAGLAPGFAWLVGARLVQGTFGALLFALVPALATTAVRPAARGRAMGLVTTLGPLGLVTGPGLGGLVVDGVGWPWVFFVNVPVSLVVLAVGLRSLPAGAPLRPPGWSWFTEALLVSGAVATMLLSLSLAAGAGPVWLLGLVIPALLLRGWHRLPTSGPVLRLLRAPGESGPHLALGLAATAIGVVFLIVPFHLQGPQGASGASTGLVLLAFPAGMALTGPVGGFLGDWWGARRTALLGCTVFTVGLVLLLPLDDSWSGADLAWRLLLAGCGNGLFNAPNMSIAMGRAPHAMLATTAATTSLARQLGFALGPALATLVWAATTYQPAGMRLAVALAAACSTASVVAVARIPRAGGAQEGAASAGEQAERGLPTR